MEVLAVWQAVFANFPPEEDLVLDMLRIIIVDDHAMVRDVLCHVIEMNDAYKLVGSAATGTEALVLLESGDVDIAIIDFAMPDMTGIEVIQQGRAFNIPTKYLLLTGSQMNETERQNIATVSEGFLHKEAGRDALLDTLESVAQADSLGEVKQSDDQCGVMKAGDLTARERGILREIARGHPVATIAKTLKISVNTVRKHREHILSKFSLHSTPQLVRAAMQIGMY